MSPREALLSSVLYEALKQAKQLIDEALPQFDWGRSCLDGNAIRLLNETPGVVNRALRLAEAQELKP